MLSTYAVADMEERDFSTNIRVHTYAGDVNIYNQDSNHNVTLNCSTNSDNTYTYNFRKNISFDCQATDHLRTSLNTTLKYFPLYVECTSELSACKKEVTFLNTSDTKLQECEDSKNSCQNSLTNTQNKYNDCSNTLRGCPKACGGEEPDQNQWVMFGIGLVIGLVAMYFYLNKPKFPKREADEQRPPINFAPR
jgi:hypothetical protein